MVVDLATEMNAEASVHFKADQRWVEAVDHLFYSSFVSG